MRRWLDVALGVLAGVMLAGIALWVALPPRGEPIMLQPPPPTPTPQPLMVDVEGAVQHPGVYALQRGSRVRDAIRMAGGFRADAMPEAVNQAAMLTDGMWIYVPFVGTPTPHVLTPTPAPLGTMVPQQALININTATAEELEALPHIGPTLAQRIIDYRTEHGPFQSVDDLIKVKGIGATLLETLRPLVTVGENFQGKP